MTVRNIVALAAIVTAPLLLSGAPAQAFSARQATAQGQGVFVSSNGTPQNMIQSAPVAQQQGAERRPLRTHQHERYFAGF